MIYQSKQTFGYEFEDVKDVLKASGIGALNGGLRSGFVYLVVNFTPIPAGETWTFDRIVLSEEGCLCVPAGATLNLPNGFKSVEGDGMFCGILYRYFLCSTSLCLFPRYFG